MKTMQKLRDRPNGVNIISLALGEKLTQEEEKLMVNTKLILSYCGRMLKLLTEFICTQVLFFI